MYLTLVIYMSYFLVYDIILERAMVLYFKLDIKNNLWYNNKKYEYINISKERNVVQNENYI